MPGLYNRVTITFQPITYKESPDYITSFSTKIIKRHANRGRGVPDEKHDNKQSIRPSVDQHPSDQPAAHELDRVLDPDRAHLAVGSLLGSALQHIRLLLLDVQSRSEWNRFEDKVKEIEDELSKEYESKHLVDAEEKEIELISNRGNKEPDRDQPDSGYGEGCKDMKLE